MVSTDMQVVDPQIISGKRVLLRLDLDVPIENGKVTEDFRLKASIPTLKLCVDNASKVIIIGHLGRLEKADPAFSLKPVCEWFRQNGFSQMTFIGDSALTMLENLRFDRGEESLDPIFAQKLALQADIFIFEAFASHRPAASTTVLPAIMPHAAGLRFAQEVKVLGEVRENPKKPLVAITGGAKVADKLPVIDVLSRKADVVLVGGELVHEIREQNLKLPGNVMVGKLTEDGFDIASETLESWKKFILNAAEIVWNGPVGKFEDAKNDATRKLAEMVLSSDAQIVIGGGDTIAALSRAGLLKKAQEKVFVSTGGGAMLKFLSDGTLPTVNALS